MQYVRRGEDYPRNLAEFEARFSTQEACRQGRPAVTPPQAPLGRWRRAERRKERPKCESQYQP